MTVRPATTLVIPTRDRPGFVVGAVSSVLAGDDVPAEIVVVDQSAAPNEWFRDREEAGGTRIRYVLSEERGLSRGRNEGIRQAAHELIAFIDDDIVVAPTWFGSLDKAAAVEGPLAIITGRVEPLKVPGTTGFAPSTITSDAPVRYTRPVMMDPLYAGNMAIPRQVFERVGLFDVRLGAGSRFPGAEDNDFGYRALRAGCTIVYDPEISVSHLEWRPTSEIAALRWRYALGQGAFFAKHTSKGDRYIGLRAARVLASRTRWLLQAVTTGDARSALPAAASLYGLSTGFLGWLLTQSWETTDPATNGQ